MVFTLSTLSTGQIVYTSCLVYVYINSFLVHGILPDSMLGVVLVPVSVIKDKSGRINAKDNYRPIA